VYSLLTWLENTAVASIVRESLLLTASLSAIHAVGFTLIMGSAVVTNLRFLGVLFPHYPVRDITDPAGRGILVGLLISAGTGLLLFATRAVAASDNRTFRLKMLLLLIAVVFHFVARRFALQRPVAVQVVRALGAVGMTLWLALALAACAYILLE
jgi:hypothetical protein